jgi:DNA-binding transcriptional MerR regulator
MNALQLYQPDTNIVYSIDVAARWAHLSRREIVVFCRRGLVSNVVDPSCGGWYFNDEGLRVLRRISLLRDLCGGNLAVARLIIELETEVERLRERLRFLQQ